MNNQILIDICDSVIKGLKDFQSATVNKICGNFLDKDNPQFRQLVADEVGMGKTIIAKGVIAKLVYNQLQNTNSDTEYEQKDNTIASQNLPKIFKIVYVCTNQTLASQNIRKLNVFSRTESEGKECSENFNNTLNTRLSMLHFQIAQIAQIDNNFPIQFISITPSTSFKLGYGKGNVNERALIYCLLSDCYKFKKYRFMLLFLILKGNVSLTNWINVCRSTAQKINEYSNYKERIQKLIKEKISKVINNESDKNNDIKIKNAKKNLKTLYKKLKSKIPNFYETSNNKYVIPSNDAPEIEEVYQNLDEKIKQHITPIINSLRSML